MRNPFLVFIFSLLAFSLFGQSVLDRKIDLQLENTSVSEALLLLAQKADIDIAFSDRYFKDAPVLNFDFRDKSIKDILHQILPTDNIKYKFRNDQLVLQKKRKNTVVKYTVSGYVEDAETGEKLIGATIYSTTHQQSCFSNAYGFYSLSLSTASTELVISFLGSKVFRYAITLDKDQELNISLDPAITLNAVIVTPDSSAQKEGLHLLDTDKNLLPTHVKLAADPGGEDDIFRMAQLLPGVQTGADGLGGLHIRGGNADQNLILLDGVPVYNATHLLGIFSIFNTSAIRSATLLKGKFPARYGGRISSVFDIRTKDGNRKAWAGNLGLSLGSFNATLEGPFANKKGSILASFRNSHSNFLLGPALQRTLLGGEGSEEDEASLKYLFRDINIKANYRFSQKDQLYFSFYKGKDVFNAEIEYEESELKEEEEILFQNYYSNELNWGNLIASLRWNHLYNNKLFSNLTLTGSQYIFNNENLFEKEVQEETTSEDFAYFYYGYASEIEDLAANIDFDYLPENNHHIRFGAGIIAHAITPEASAIDEETFVEKEDSIFKINQFSDIDTPTQLMAWEGHAYVEDEFILQKKLQLNIGLRASAFVQGKARYGYLEPRVNLRYPLEKNFSAFASANRMVQYLHRINASGLSTPNDVWIPSSSWFKPQTSWQYELGFDFEKAQNYHINLSGYFKQMSGLLSFNATNPFADFEEDFSDELIVGDGTTYGIECAFQKLFGRTGGWVNYTFAHTKRQFAKQNLGYAYPHQFDSRHQFKVYLFHKFNKYFTISANWHYRSAPPLLLLSENQFIEDVFALDVNPPGKKNTKRSEDYHRLDVALSYAFTSKKMQHRLKVSVYNLYNRANVAFHQVEDIADIKNGQPVSFLPVLPGVGYEVGF